MPAEDARRRFEDATRRHLLVPLLDGVEVRACTAEEWTTHADPWWADADRDALDLSPLYSSEQRAAIADLDAVLSAPLEHRVLLWRDGAPVGAYLGVQEAFGRYYMVNTILQPAVRGRGLYRALLANLEQAVAAAGFREMYSRHRADNNAVIVPKLKAGWNISGFEVTLRFGLLVHLRRYLHDGFARAFAHRIDGSHAEALRAAGLRIP